MSTPSRPSPKEYLVEVYVPRLGEDELQRAAERARSAAEEMSREGIPLRFIRSVFIPEDETCFWLYEGPSAAAVGEASRRAAISFERVVEARQFAAQQRSDCGRRDFSTGSGNQLSGGGAAVIVAGAGACFRVRGAGNGGAAVIGAGIGAAAAR